MHTNDYIIVMMDSLQKKVLILDKIIEKNKVQRIILKEETINPDEFEQNLIEKSDLIERLEGLDDGFEQLYTRVKDTLAVDREQYSEQIKKMQDLIKQITEKSTMVQVQEKRNKELAEIKFADTRKKIRQVKTSKKVASQYYQSMAKVSYDDPQFMDRKK